MWREACKIKSTSHAGMAAHWLLAQSTPLNNCESATETSRYEFGKTETRKPNTTPIFGTPRSSHVRATHPVGL